MISRNKRESEKGICLSGNRCVICGWDKRDYQNKLLTVGAHVRPFENTRDYDQYNNIIALCPNHHSEFERGNITIDPIRKICLHIVSDDEYHGKKVAGKIDHIAKGFFDYHRKHKFKGNINFEE